MTKSGPGYAGQAIQRILDCQQTQKTRCRTTKRSAAFHSLTGTIAAYSKALAILAALQQREEFF